MIENMSAFTCAHGESHPLFGEGGGEELAATAGAPLLGSIPLEPAVSRGGDDGRPVAAGDGPAAEAFRALAERVVTEAIPPIEMAGCTARVLEAVRTSVAPEATATTDDGPEDGTPVRLGAG